LPTSASNYVSRITRSNPSRIRNRVVFGLFVTAMTVFVCCLCWAHLGYLEDKRRRLPLLAHDDFDEEEKLEHSDSDEEQILIQPAIAGMGIVEHVQPSPRCCVCDRDQYEAEEEERGPIRPVCGANHLACEACLAHFIERKLIDGGEIKCLGHSGGPNGACQQRLNTDMVQGILRAQSTVDFQRFYIEDYLVRGPRLAIKQCPGCRADTERNGGCNTMTCSQCQIVWCWDCGEPQVDGPDIINCGCSRSDLEPSSPESDVSDDSSHFSAPFASRRRLLRSQDL